MRWVLERAFTWLQQFRRLRIRWERRPERHQAFMAPGPRVHLPALPQSFVKRALKGL
jgi:transposase